MSIVYLYLNGINGLNPPISPITVPIAQKSIDIKPNAFIITADCNSSRYNATKQNIEARFPNFFNLLCFRAIPLNDSRIYPGNVPVVKKLSSNLLAFVQLWSYEIPKYSKGNENQWSFIFEDDVNFINGQIYQVTNISAAVQEMMNNRQIQYDDGFFYLGICGPVYSRIDAPILIRSTNDGIVSRKGNGYCLHASAITPKRSRLLWSEISSHRPSPGELSLDYQLRAFCNRSNTSFYVLGTNLEYPPGTGHYGIAFQDRGRFESTVSEDV